jgi:hypothetical protein
MKSYICLDYENKKLFILTLNKNKMILNGVLWEYKISNILHAETGKVIQKTMFIYHECMGPNLVIEEEIEI